MAPSDYEQPAGSLKIVPGARVEFLEKMLSIRMDYFNLPQEPWRLAVYGCCTGGSAVATGGSASPERHFGCVDRTAWRANDPPSARSAMGAGRVQRHGRANKSLQCLLVNLLALVEVDGTPGVAIEAGVEEA